MLAFPGTHDVEQQSLNSQRPACLCVIARIKGMRHHAWTHPNTCSVSVKSLPFAHSEWMESEQSEQHAYDVTAHPYVRTVLQLLLAEMHFLSSHHWHPFVLAVQLAQ